MEYYPNGSVKSEEYIIKNKLHNYDGPAYQKWDEHGTLIKSDYYLDGVKQGPLIKRAR